MERTILAIRFDFTAPFFSPVEVDAHIAPLSNRMIKYI